MMGREVGKPTTLYVFALSPQPETVARAWGRGVWVSQGRAEAGAETDDSPKEKLVA